MIPFWFEDLWNNYFVQIKSPSNFIKEAEDFYLWWLSIPENYKPVGFLTFHRELIKSYKTVLKISDNPWDQSKFSKLYKSEIDNAETVEAFSSEMQKWVKSKIEGSISQQTQVIQIYNLNTEEFWGLYSFINGKFSKWLEKNKKDYDYDDSKFNHQEVKPSSSSY